MRGGGGRNWVCTDESMHPCDIVRAVCYQLALCVDGAAARAAVAAKASAVVEGGGGGQTKQQDLGSSNAPNLATSCGTNLIHRRRHPLKCMRERMRSCVCMSACAYACANECVDYIQSFVSVDGRGSVSVCY